MTSPVPDALRTQLAEDRARIAEALNKAGYGPVFADGRFVGVVADLLARARMEGAAEALREAAKDPKLQGLIPSTPEWLMRRAAALSAAGGQEQP